MDHPAHLCLVFDATPFACDWDQYLTDCDINDVALPIFDGVVVCHFFLFFRIHEVIPQLYNFAKSPYCSL